MGKEHIRTIHRTHTMNNTIKLPVWRILAAIALGIAAISWSVMLLNTPSDLAFIGGIVLICGSVFYITKVIVTMIGKRIG
jgi:hypothetical protein